MPAGEGIGGAMMTTLLAPSGGDADGLAAAVRAALAVSAGIALLGAGTSWQR